MLDIIIMKIIFYTGPQCGLCGLAEELIAQLPNYDLEVEKINIRQSPELYHLYGARIPVLKIETQSGAKELGWPFDLYQLENFVS